MRPTRPVIGLISREYPPLTHVGGIGTYTATAARLLADHGHEVHVFCNGPETERVDEAGITVHRLRMGKHPLPASRFLFWYRRWFRNRLPNYLDALTWAHTVARYLRDEAPDLKLNALEYPETNGEGALLKVDAGLNKTRRVCRIHTSWIPEYVTGSMESRRLLRLQIQACAKADRVVSPSRAMAVDYARKILGWKKPVARVPNPLQLWPQPIAWKEKDPRHILFVGRIEHRKGIDLLLQVLDDLGDAANGITLRIVASLYPPNNPADALCQEWFAKARKNHENGASENGYRLEYPGPVPHPDLHSHFDWAGMVVLPSRQDNFPYVALEALSRGCFVLGSDAGGLPETLEGCRGDIFPSGDKGALSRKMRELTRNGERIRDSWRHNATAIAERFEPEICYARLLETYVGNAEPELYHLSKRLLDILGALVGLFFFFLTFLPLALCIKLESRGPIFFVQTRVGRYGRRFKFVKFRTMAVGAHHRQWELHALNETGGVTFKVSRDPRITRVGKWLRRSSLDEIPQFWNVLKGEMSLVGPRPPLLHEVGRYDRNQQIRMTVPQGLTGLWQVRGRSSLGFDKMVDLDVQYALHADLNLDLRILAMTFPVVFRGRGAV